VLLSFASDNYAPAHPDVLAAVAAANADPEPAYGGDQYSEQLEARAEEIFGWGATVFPVLNGTGANVLSLMASAPRWGGVVTSDVAHANTDENGAPERVGGLKILPSPTTDGKLTPADIESWARQTRDVHRAQPSVVSLTQATEVGTVYRPEEIQEIVDTAHDLGLLVHIDGARLMNAAAFLGTGLGKNTSALGVDIVSLGASKNGGLIGEAVVVMGPGETSSRKASELRRTAIESLPFLRKSTMQLASKTRFISAQLLALLGAPATRDAFGVPFETRLWRRNAEHANEMATLLRAGIDDLGGDAVRPTQPTESNAVFATLPRTTADKFLKRVRFYEWGPGETPDRVEARWMTSWATTPQEVEQFLEALREVQKPGAR